MGDIPDLSSGGCKAVRVRSPPAPPNPMNKAQVDKLCRDLAKEMLRLTPTPSEEQLFQMMIRLIYYYESDKTRRLAIS